MLLCKIFLECLFMLNVILKEMKGFFVPYSASQQEIAVKKDL